MAHERFESHRRGERSRGELEHLAAVGTSDEEGRLVEATESILLGDQVVDGAVDDRCVAPGVEKREHREGCVQVRVALIPISRTIGAK